MQCDRHILRTAQAPQCALTDTQLSEEDFVKMLLLRSHTMFYWEPNMWIEFRCSPIQCLGFLVRAWH
jgi:hypothetical protein